jgi:hypothetical protein
VLWRKLTTYICQYGHRMGSVNVTAQVVMRWLVTAETRVSSLFIPRVALGGRSGNGEVSSDFPAQLQLYYSAITGLLSDSKLILILWSWALLQRPPVMKPLHSFLPFYGTQRFITAFTRAHHLSQSSPHHPILSLQDPSYYHPFIFVLVFLVHFSSSSHQYRIWVPPRPLSCYMPHPSHYPRLVYSNYTWRSL